MRRAIELLVGSVVVYGVMAACSGGAKVADRSKPGAAAGEPATAAGGVPDATSSGAPGREAGAPSMASGGLMDPVPSAGAQEGGATGAGCTCEAAPPSYTKHVVVCNQLIKMSGTNYPAAILDISPPSVLTAARTLIVSEELASAPGWQTAGSGVMMNPDGSSVASTCASKASSITFYVPN